MQIDNPKVVVLLDRLGSGAGGEASLLDFALALGNLGCKVDVLVARSTVSQRKKLESFLHKRTLGFGAIRVNQIARTLDFYVARSVNFVDFIHRKRHRLTAARFLLIPARQKVKKSLREANIVLSTQVLSRRGVNQLKFLARKAKLVLSHNGDLETFSEKWKARERFDGSDPFAEYGNYLSEFDEILFQSDEQELEFREFYPFVPAGLSTIWPSCDENKCSEAQTSPSPLDSDRINFVYVAKFQPTKNQFELIEAFSQITADFPRATLTLVGGTIFPQEYLERCKYLVSRSGLDERVRFTGHRDDSCRFIFHSDCVIHPSKSEGVSRAIREAAFLGKPIICSNLTGLRSFLGQSGALYLSESSAEAIEKALRVALREKSLLEEVAHNALAAYDDKAAWTKFEHSCGDLVKRLF